MRRNPERRCSQCLVHIENCFCTKLKEIKLSTKISFILPRIERSFPSNTANIVLNSMPNSSFFERGHQGCPVEESFLERKNYTPLYLYPSNDAEELTPELIKSIDNPIHLIIPDGTWRQAKKIYRREVNLHSVKQIKINPLSKSIYPLRRQKFDEGLCTFEATAEAIKLIEDESTYRLMMDNFQIFLDAHLKNRVIFEKQS